MTDPNTPTTPSSNPQDLIDQALGGTPTPTVTPDPTTEVTEPTLPTPEPLNAPAAVVEETPVITEPALPPAETVPTELTTTPVIPTMSEPAADTKPMGEDMPLAFAGMSADVAADTNLNNVSAPIIEPVNNVVPPILTNPALTAPVNKGNGAMSKVKMVIVAALAFFGIAGATGYWAYNQFGTVSPATIAAIKDQTEDTCSGCVNGGWMRWDKKTGTCKHTGICGNDKPDKNTEDPTIISDAQKYNSKDSCNTSGKGYVWCESVDSNNKPYSFCNTSGTGCNQAAIDKGYTIRVGVLKCVQQGNSWVLDRSYYDNNAGQGAQTADEVLAAYKATTGKSDDPCSIQYSTTTGKEQYICKEGVVGQGNGTQPGIPYTGGACTALNGKKFTGNLNCFCGTVQVDTANGHESYTSTCGCNKPEETPNPSPTPTPSVPVVSTLMCSNLTRTPTTTPVIGDKVTFTCVGASIPAGSVNLSYKFRYSLNSGSYINLTNTTATTSELMVAACGTYSVECQACGTINGVLTCDPNWAGATTQ